MKRIIFFLFSVCVLYAEEQQNIAMSNMPQEITQTDVVMQNAISDAKNKDITPKSVEDFFEEFADKNDIVYAENKNGRVFFMGKATVVLPSTDPNFAKALNLAFDEAMLNLQAEFIRDTFGRQSTAQMQKLFSDDSSNAREFEKLPVEGKMTQLLNKAASLAGAQLDKALQELGVNVEGLSEERKKVLFADSLIQQIQTMAVGNMQGLVPVQTVMTQVNDANYEVGIIAVMSPKTKQVAEDIKLKRPSIIKGNGKNIREFLPENNKDYLNEYGIRMLYDENGSPVIISYGQWSYLPNNDTYTSNRKKQNAEEQAISRADSAIAAFVNSAINYKRSTENSKDVETAITQIIRSDSTTEEEKSAKNIIDKTTQEVKMTSNLQLRGIRTLKKWSTKDENGIEYVGAVRMYSYANVANTNELLVPKAQQQRTNNTQSQAVDVSRKSTVVNSMDDF